MVKPLLISTTDINGGAARAAYRLHQSLHNIGISSQMLVKTKYSDDDSVLASATKLSKGIEKLKPTLDALPLKLYRQRDSSVFSLQWIPDQLNTKVAQINPDVINLHWINFSYLKIETLAKFKKPIIWTLHDMWAFTGGCHYSGDCDNYTKSCGVCLQLGSQREKDASRWVWQRKAKAWKNINLTVVSPSKWLAECAKKSSLFENLQIEVIPNGLNIEIYKPIDKKFARNLLNLPLDKKLILFGAVKATSDKRKGFHLLLPALQKISKYIDKENIELVVFGASQPSNPPQFGLKTHYLGNLNDDISLSLVYSSADVLVAPSIEDNLPNAIMEALACGTPCIGFKIGGLSDMIDHYENGYLAKPLDTEDLANGIVKILENDNYYSQFSLKARKKVIDEFSFDLQANRYLKIFKSLTLGK
jgi:glycosyltransferase involved in cell wall biosynthesis